MKSKQLFHFIAVLFIALATFSLAGGHWALLQGIAWTNMIHNYSAQGSFSNAVAKTFSGKYRCSLCQKIAEEKQKEKKTEAVENHFQKIKLSSWNDVALMSIPWPKEGCYPKIISSRYCDVIAEPPARPPRAEFI